MRIKSVFFAFLLIASVLFTAGSSAKSLVNQEAGKRHAFYQRALYEAAEAMSGMQVTLKKLTVTRSKAMETEYLSKITSYASNIQNSLSTLPIGISEINETMKFVNQTGDFALSALKKISKGGALSESDRENILSLLNTATNMCITMGEVTESFLSGKKTFCENENQTSNAFSNLTHPKEEYPTLLYDGPFSDSVLDKRMQGLGENEVTMEEARKILSNFLEADESRIEFHEETGGSEKTYVFSLKDKNAEAAVTKRGGKVLYLLSENEFESSSLSDEECVSIAKAFLHKKGFGDMHESYFRKYEGAITINLAPVENDIILYTDLIKMEVSMQTGEIIGMEFTNYYMNHHERNLTKDEYQNADVSEYEGMSVLSVRPALIPVDATEKLAVEIHVKDQENEYLIYKDMVTMDEIMLYEVVHTPDGSIVQ